MEIFKMIQTKGVDVVEKLKEYQNIKLLKYMIFSIYKESIGFFVIFNNTPTSDTLYIKRKNTFFDL